MTSAAGSGMMGHVGDYARQPDDRRRRWRPRRTLLGRVSAATSSWRHGGDRRRYKTYRDYQAGQQNQGHAPAHATGGYGAADFALPPPESPFAPANAPMQLAETLIVAMIAAAKADGHIDAEERGRIYHRLEEGGLQAEEIAFLQRELTEPVDMDRIVAGPSAGGGSRDLRGLGDGHPGIRRRSRPISTGSPGG
jgi:hypothetical protein